MNCPGCGQPMQQHTLEGNYGIQVEIDACPACSGLWFDRKEHLQLTPGSTLQLIRLMHLNQRTTSGPLALALGCPRCGEKLVSTVDLQRNTRFSYFCCPQGDGHFITLFHFLREKNIVRSLDVRQINELKKRVKVLCCSNCGAPIDLEKESICSYCHSPISMLDPIEIQTTLAELQKREDTRSKVDPTVAAKLVMDKLSVERFYGQLDRAGPSYRPSPGGLIEAGISALMNLLDDL